jgi:hypothetical protein
MADFLTSATNAGDNALRRRVRVAMVIAGLAVQGEASASPATPITMAKRAVLASKILASGGGDDDLLMSFVWAVVSPGLVTPASTDSDIQFTVNSIFSDMAGVTGTDV